MLEQAKAISKIGQAVGQKITEVIKIDTGATVMVYFHENQP